MNKTFKTIFIASSLAMGLTVVQSCKESDVIELYPEFSLDAISNPSSVEQIEEVLLGAYAGFRSANYYSSGSGTGSGWALMPDVLSDNLWETANESLANSRAMADWVFNSNTGQINTIYNAPYSIIATVNIILRDIDGFATEANQLRINRLKGQAYAIRALAHFDLFRYFASSYDRSSTSDLAVYYSREFIVSTEQKPARHNNAEFYGFLFSDLEQAASLLANVDAPINSSSSMVRPFIDLTAVYALQARVNLYAQNWAEAETAASNAISLRPLVNLDQAAYSGMYNQTSAGEIIWNAQFESGQSGPTFLVYFSTANRNYFRPAFEIATADGDEGLIQSNDIRYDAFFKIGTGGLLSVSKYQGKDDLLDGAANFVSFKTGELYLIRAEARAMTNQAALALDDLNTLRAARINGYVNETALSGDPLLDAIADERRRELFGEGHRFFDLKRTTRTIQRGSTCGNVGLSPTGNCTLPSTAREWALPIPEAVMNANENAVQNAGW